MVFFQTKNPNLGKFWRAFKWKMLEYFMAIWNILRPFGIFWYIFPFGKLVIIWYIFPRFGTQEKSGNPGTKHDRRKARPDWSVFSRRKTQQSQFFGHVATRGNFCLILTELFSIHI
jgi:hypothetical protein